MTATPNPLLDAAQTAEVLARWEAEADAVRARQTGEPGVAPLADWLPREPMDFFRAMIEGRVPRPPISQTLDFLLVHVQPGFAVFQGRPGRAHYNPLGGVHGGWFATLLDSALGCCVHSALPAGRAYTTLELKVNMIRAMSERTGPVRAEGRLVHLGGQTATAEARLLGPEGRLYAHASTTCLVFAPGATSPKP